MTKVIKPLLATKADYGKIQYPVLATPKLDGIRCLMVDGVAMSRSMKPIPNDYVRKQLEGLHGLDGELMVNGDFNEVQSGIMKKSGEPDFTYHVFDSFTEEGGYKERIDNLLWSDDNINCLVLMPIVIHTEAKLDAYLEKCLADGYEGVMIRDPNGKYKHGRSTVKEGILLKIKKFFDDEAILVDVIEKMHNANDLDQDEFGYAKRRSCKENLVPCGTAGSLVLNWKKPKGALFISPNTALPEIIRQKEEYHAKPDYEDIEFRVGFGPGITDAIKQDIWDRREELTGEITKFSYQELSKDGVPRFGKMLEFRHEDDL